MKFWSCPTSFWSWATSFQKVDFSYFEDYKKKLETVKESYFGKKTETKESLDDVAAGESSNEDLSKAMAAYSAAISKTKDIKLSIK